MILRTAFLALAALVAPCALAQEKKSNHDVAGCLSDPDVPVCLLRNAYPPQLIYGDLTFRSSPVLMEEILGPPAPGAPSYLSLKDLPATYADARERAIGQALALARSGAEAGEALKPISDLPDRPGMYSQVQVSPGSEHRAIAFARVWESYSQLKADAAPIGLDVALDALKGWEENIDGVITDEGRRAASPEALAEAYGRIKDADAVRRVLRRIHREEWDGAPDAYAIRLQSLALTGEYAAARAELVRARMINGDDEAAQSRREQIHDAARDALSGIVQHAETGDALATIEDVLNDRIRFAGAAPVIAGTIRSLDDPSRKRTLLRPMTDAWLARPSAGNPLTGQDLARAWKSLGGHNETIAILDSLRDLSLPTSTSPMARSTAAWLLREYRTAGLEAKADALADAWLDAMRSGAACGQRSACSGGEFDHLLGAAGRIQELMALPSPISNRVSTLLNSDLNYGDGLRNLDAYLETTPELKERELLLFLCIMGAVEPPVSDFESARTCLERMIPIATSRTPTELEIRRFEDNAFVTYGPYRSAEGAFHIAWASADRGPPELHWPMIQLGLSLLEAAPDAEWSSFIGSQAIRAWAVSELRRQGRLPPKSPS